MNPCVSIFNFLLLKFHYIYILKCFLVCLIKIKNKTKHKHTHTHTRAITKYLFFPQKLLYPATSYFFPLKPTISLSQLLLTCHIPEPKLLFMKSPLTFILLNSANISHFMFGLSQKIKI